MILEAFWVGYNVWAGLCHLYFPCPCLRLSLMPAWVYCRASCVVRVSVVLAVMWRSAVWFGCFLGDLFPVGFGRLALFSCDFWVANVTSEKVLVCEIPTFWLSGNRQEKARKWSLIFSKLNFTVWSKCCGYFMFFIFELQLWKKLVFWICFCVVWQFSVASDKVLYLFGNQVGEGQRKLLGVNCFKHFNCYNFFSCDEAGVLDLHGMLFEFLFCEWQY